MGSEPIIAIARDLRRRGTLPERLLWNAIRNRALGWCFGRQHPIPPYVVDFYCAERSLVVEVDGAFHWEPDVERRDRVRQAFLEAQGCRFIRFSATQILDNLEGVLIAIRLELGEHESQEPHRGSPSSRERDHASPSPRARGEVRVRG